MSDENDVIYGAHPVEEALKNPKRKFVKLTCTLNGAERLKALPTSWNHAGNRKSQRCWTGRLEPDAVHQGMILEAKPLRQPQLEEIEQSGVVVMLDQVTDPHNVGAILAAVPPSRRRRWSPRRAIPPRLRGSFQSRIRGLRAVPIVKVTNLARAMEELRDAGFRLVGLDARLRLLLSRSIKPRRWCWFWAQKARAARAYTQKLRCGGQIRLFWAIRSLNVSNAAAVALYALTR